MITQFMKLCTELGVPVALDKMEWGVTALIFLGILLNGLQMSLFIPLEKQQRALWLINDMMNKKKATIKEIQTLTGYLNFLAKAIHPGRTFTRQIYAKCSTYSTNKAGYKLKQHHHVKLDSEFKFDCAIW